jgi:DNA replication protein DnaC
MCKTLNSNQSYTGDDVTRNWMVLFGSVGTTKTGLTAAFMNYVLAEGGDVVWHKFDTLLRRARKAIDDGGSMDSILQAYATAPVLVLDEFKGANMLVNHDGRIESTYDVGITELSRFERASAELIINTRYNAGLPTLFTTNSDFAGMEAYWGQLIAGRLMTAHWIPVQGGNERPVPPNIGAV